MSEWDDFRSGGDVTQEFKILRRMHEEVPAEPSTEGTQAAQQQEAVKTVCACGALVVKQEDGTGLHYGAWFSGTCRYIFPAPAAQVDARKCECGHDSEAHYMGCGNHCGIAGCNCNQFEPAVAQTELPPMKLELGDSTTAAILCAQDVPELRIDGIGPWERVAIRERQLSEFLQRIASLTQRLQEKEAENVKLRESDSLCGKENCIGRKVKGARWWVTQELFENTKAQLTALQISHDAVLESVCKLRKRFDSDMIVEGSEDDILFDRVYAAIAAAEKLRGPQPEESEQK